MLWTCTRSRGEHEQEEPSTRWKWLRIRQIYEDTLMAAAKLYYLLNWDINDETIRIIKARIRHDSITYRLSHGCTLYARMCVCVGMYILPTYSTFFFGSNFSLYKTRAVCSQHLGNRKKKYVQRKLFLRYLTNISKLWPFTSWQYMCERVCVRVIVYILSYMCDMCIRWTKFPSKWNGAISLCKHRIVCNSMFWFLNCFLYLRFYRLSRTHTHTHSGHVVKQNFNKQEKKLCINNGHRRTISDGNFQLMWQYWLNDEKRKTKFAGKATENKLKEKKKTIKQRISNIAAWRENGIVDGDRKCTRIEWW